MKNPWPMILLLPVWLLVMWPVAGFGLGSRIANQDAEAVARGNAFVATADNPSAVYYNPAGITQLKGTNLRMGSYLVTVESDYHSAGGGHASTKDKLAMVPQMFGTFTPPNSKLSFGVGMYSPFGLGTDWRHDTGFSELATITKLSYVRISPVVAMELAPGLSIGAGPALNYSSVILKTALPSPGDEFSFDGNNFDFSFNAGLLWKINGQFTTGFSYQGASTIDYRGATKFVPFTGEMEASAGLEFPQSFSWGLSYRPDSHWNVEFDIEYTDWDSLKTAVIHQDGGDLSIPFHWEGGFMYKLGATYDFGNGWAASAGYFYTEQTVPDSTFNPGIPDTEVHTGSLGISYRRGHWTYAAAAQLTMGPRRDVQGSPVSAGGQSADGQYQYIMPAVNLTMGYHF